MEGLLPSLQFGERSHKSKAGPTATHNIFCVVLSLHRKKGSHRAIYKKWRATLLIPINFGLDAPKL